MILLITLFQAKPKKGKLKLPRALLNEKLFEKILTFKIVTTDTLLEKNVLCNCSCKMYYVQKREVSFHDIDVNLLG